MSKKDFRQLSVKEVEAIKLLEQLMAHKGWAVLMELIEKNDVAGLEQALLADEDILDADGLDGIIRHSWRMRWTKAKIQILRGIKHMPQNYIDIISEAAGLSDRTGDPWVDAPAADADE